MTEKKDFFVLKIKEDAGALAFETYYTNIRHKKKQIEAFKKRVEELGDCDESTLLLQECETIQQEIIEYMDLFRGKITVREKSIVYVPMDIYHALDYLGYLIADNIDNNIHTIRNLMNALEYETGSTKKDKEQVSYYKKLVNHFRGKVK